MTDDTAVDRENLAEGYRRRAERAMALACELNGVSQEANEELDDTPDW
jgi:hypothetical protein